jgi:hypothetical protein
MTYRRRRLDGVDGTPQLSSTADYVCSCISSTMQELENIQQVAVSSSNAVITERRLCTGTGMSATFFKPPQHIYIYIVYTILYNIYI